MPASKKDRKISDMMNDFGSTAGNKPDRAFTGYDDDLLSAIQPESITSDEIPIMSIHADPIQPRNIIPGEIRGAWDGDPAKMPELLQAWAEMLYDSGNDMPIAKILKGQVESGQYMKSEKYIHDFVKLLELAGSIRSLGLNQPIGVRPIGDTYRIIFGERRWTAVHMLNLWLPGEDHTTIPVKIIDVSEWQLRTMQIAENNQRQDTNAIAKAREFALLLITARSDTDNYDPPHVLNAPDCNRPYYAQVANGEVHRIPRGMGAEFEQALGISTGQMRHYRNLLKLTGDYQVDNTIWNLADNNDWAEGFMRDIGNELELDTIREILHTVTTVTVSQIEEAFREAIESAKNARKLAQKQKQRDEKPYLNRWVELHTGWIGRVIEQDGNRLTLEDIDGNTTDSTVPSLIDVDVTPRSNSKSPSNALEGDLGGGSKPSGETTGKSELAFKSNDPVGTRFNLGTSDEPEPARRFKPTETVFYDGTIPARVRGYNQDGIQIMLWNGEQRIVSENDLLPLDEQKYIELVLSLKSKPQNTGRADNSSSQPADPAIEWVGKPAIYNDEPCFVIQTKKGQPGHVVIQSGKERHTIHYAALKPAIDKPGQTLTDYMAGDEDQPENTGAGDVTPTHTYKLQYLITGMDRGFIQNIATGAGTEGLKFTKLTEVYRLRKDGVDETLPDLLEGAMQEIEAYTAHLHKKATEIFADVVRQYQEDTDAD